LPGTAITSVRVSGVAHEFTTIPGAKEDMLRLILNLKQVRLVSHAEGSVRMRVAAKGKSVITAGDIECPAEVEVINPELQLLTLDVLDSDLELELEAETGVGYSPAEDRRAKLPIGQIPVDAIFSPIVKVNNVVESARIEQMTNYDLLRLEIWTDGTMRPGDALIQSAQLLMDHFSPLAAFSGTVPLTSVEPRPMVSSDLYDVQIETLELQARAFNCLKRAGIVNVGQIIERLGHGGGEMLAIRNFGQKSLLELVEKLRDKGYLPGDYQLDV
jgi:DNA-directed RNA polymerase subunit alpha